MFPAQVRALGVGLSYAVANAIFGGSAEYVALSLEINRNGNSLLLVCDLDGRGGVSGFFDATSQREGDASLVTGQLPDGIAGACTGDIPSQILPAPAASFGAAIPKLFDAPKLTENINPNMALRSWLIP